jgi:hypothetical protein
MGGLGKLSQFSGIKPKQEISQDSEPTNIESDSEVESKVQESESIDTSEVKTQNQELKQKKSKPKKNNYELRTPNYELKKKLVTVNIKITKSQKDWLAETATQVRDNSTEPVPPAERVYPQHLIGVAIDLLNGAQVDWTQVKNVEDLREQLNL